MMNRNRICPDCEIEYLPHIEKCADCGAKLLLLEEYRQAREEKKRLMAKVVESTAVVREGELKWLTKLRDVLIDAGISCKVVSDPGCNKGRCGNKCRLIVSEDDREKAQEHITEYYMEVYPELRASNELLSQGKCPACGSVLGAGDKECPDCGLMLVIVEEENREEEDGSENI